MTLSLAIALNAALVVSLLGGLAWFMSHPRKLTPHVSTRHPGDHLSLVHREAHLAERRREEQNALAA
jgi:hypothetical protein